MALEKKYYSGEQVFDIIKELPCKDFLSLLNTFANERGADVAEVKHGKWLGETYQYPDRVTLGWFNCSMCGERGNKAYNYCPNCGARMDK